MKQAFAHRSPTIPATLAAAIGMSLSVLLLTGVGVQGEPTPLLPAIGGAAGRVAADLPATASARPSEPVGKAASSAQPAATRTEDLVPQRRQAATSAHRIHRHAPTRAVRPAPAAPVQAPAPASPATPVTARQFSSTATKAKGKARGHGHRGTPKAAGGAPAPRAHGHGKALGRSSEHHHGPPPGHAKKAPTAPSPPATPPKDNGGGNGHKGGKK
jgi:hypothetical protein